MSRAPQYDEAERRRQILAAALESFLRYGYARTRMEDVAQAAGISRPLLYRQFAGKEALFFALVSDFSQQGLERARVALEGDGALWDRVVVAFEGWSEDYERHIDDSPHGRELIDVTASVAGDAIAESYRSLENLFTHAIEGAVATGQVDLGAVAARPRELAELLVRASLGFKDDDGGHSRFQARVGTLVRALRAATAP